ncbi:hypothetical protein ScPMuIL_012345 [Solemya velum]
MEWSGDVYKFHDVVEHISFPCFVRVERDYGSESRMQTFVSGDVLRIDKLTVRKCVCMQKVDIKTDALSDEFLVPLDFKTFVQHVVIDTNKKYSFLHEILNDYPRFVKVNGTFKSPIGKVFTKGSQFEVLRVFGINDEKRVLVNYEGEEMFLPAFTAGLFSSVEDEAVYLLKDFSIAPRFVRPLNLNFESITTLSGDKVLQICGVRDINLAQGSFIFWRGVAQGCYSIDDCEMGKFLLHIDSPIEVRVQQGKLPPGFEADDDEQISPRPRIRSEAVADGHRGITAGLRTHYQKITKPGQIDISTTEHGATIADIFSRPEDRGVRRCETDSNLKLGKTGNRDKQENQEQRKLFNSNMKKSSINTETPSHCYSDSDSSQPPYYMNTPIPPHRIQSAPTSPTAIFETYTVGQLCNVLQRCELLSLVTVCTEEKIDGYLFSRLQNEDFRKPPFNLNNLEIRKVLEMVSGWRPNI